jgi:hypothetical protein
LTGDEEGESCPLEMFPMRKEPASQRGAQRRGPDRLNEHDELDAFKLDARITDGRGHLHGSLRAGTHVADETLPLDQVLDLVDRCFEPFPDSGCELPRVTVPSNEKNECRWCHVFAPVQSRLPESVFDLRRTRRWVFREFLTGQDRQDRLAFNPKVWNVRSSQLRERQDAAG